MASHDVRKLNPGIQVDNLFVGVASKVNPHLVKETSGVGNFGLKTLSLVSGGANPNLAFALNASGSLMALNNPALLEVSGVFFNGTNEYLDLATDADFDFNYNTPYSLSAWVGTTSNAAQAPISKMNSTDSYRGWDMYLYQGKVSAHLTHTWSSSAIKVTTTTAMPTVNDGDGHSIVITYDGSTNANGMTIYIDGTSASIDINNDNLGNDDTTNSIDINIGRREYGVYMNGFLAHVSVWNKELNSTEVTAIYNSGKPGDLSAHAAAGNLIAWWKTGNGISGSTKDCTNSTTGSSYVYDMSTGSHHMTPKTLYGYDTIDV